MEVITTMNYCSACGEKVETISEFCISCGVNFLKNTQKENSEKESLSDFDNRKVEVSLTAIRLSFNKKLLIGIVTLSLSIVLIMSVGGKDAPEDVAEEFIENTINREWNKAEALWSNSGKDYLISQFFGNERMVYITMKNLSHRVHMESSQSKLAEYKVVSKEIDGNQAGISFDLIFDDGKREKVMFAMIKEEGEWKVFGFE